MIKFLSLIAVAIAIFTCGCHRVYRPAVNPNKSDLTVEQSALLQKSKLRVPCRVEVHCPDVLTGTGSTFWRNETFYYPLQEIIRNSFTSAAGKLFESPRNEIIDAFTIYVTVPESQLRVSGDDAHYTLQVIVIFKEPGEKKIDAFEITKSLDGVCENRREVPPVVYDLARDVAFQAMRKLATNPKVLKTVKRLEDR